MNHAMNITNKSTSTWEQDLMESPALTAKPDEKGYLANYLDGIYPDGRNGIMRGGKFYPMFENGNGNELKTKACAVHSSSMLAYNFFHWISPTHPLRFVDGTIYDKVYFEVKMPVLKTSTNAPANMDVVLLSQDCHNMLCFESKLSEFCKSEPSKFADSYTKHENYYNNHFAEDFIKYIQNFTNVEHAYNEGIAQMVKHLIAITNLHQSNYAMTDMLMKNTFIEPEVAQKMQKAHLDIKYTNVLCNLPNDSSELRPNKTIRYIKMLANFRNNNIISENLWQYFVLPTYVYTYSDMLAIMHDQMPKGLADYLKVRYPMLHAHQLNYPIYRV